MSGFDELSHILKQGAQQQWQEQRPFAFGHIASYDPATGRCRCIVPTLRGEDGTPVLTPWIKLGTGYSGNGFGLQVCPEGGASYENPTAGEPVLLCIVDSESGTTVAGMMLFNDNTMPPFPNIQPGEAGMKASTGSFLYLHQDNSVEINTTENNGVVNINAGSGDVNVNTTGVCSLPANTVVNGTLTVTGPLQLAGAIQSETGGIYAGNIETGGNVVAKAGTADSVGLDTHGHPANNEPPNPGT